MSKKQVSASRAIQFSTAVSETSVRKSKLDVASLVFKEKQLKMQQRSLKISK
jgi:hypothetical protein